MVHCDNAVVTLAEPCFIPFTQHQAYHSHSTMHHWCRTRLSALEYSCAMGPCLVHLGALSCAPWVPRMPSVPCDWFPLLVSLHGSAPGCPMPCALGALHFCWVPGGLMLCALEALDALHGSRYSTALISSAPCRALCVDLCCVLVWPARPISTLRLCSWAYGSAPQPWLCSSLRL